MNGLVKAICCHGSDACNEDPHTQLAVTMGIGRSVATSHMPCLTFWCIQRKSRRLSGILKKQNKIKTFKDFIGGELFVGLSGYEFSVCFEIVIQAWRKRQIVTRNFGIHLQAYMTLQLQGP